MRPVSGCGSRPASGRTAPIGIFGAIRLTLLESAQRDPPPPRRRRHERPARLDDLHAGVDALRLEVEGIDRARLRLDGDGVLGRIDDGVAHIGGRAHRQLESAPREAQRANRVAIAGVQPPLADGVIAAQVGVALHRRQPAGGDHLVGVVQAVGVDEQSHAERLPVDA